jgi:hypothetical protein
VLNYKQMGYLLIATIEQISGSYKSSSR